MTFILKDSIVCAGKYRLNINSQNSTCDLRYIASSDNSENKIYDADFQPVKLKLEAFDLLKKALKGHWTYVDFSDLQI